MLLCWECHALSCHTSAPRVNGKHIFALISRLIVVGWSTRWRLISWPHVGIYITHVSILKICEMWKA